MGTREEAGESGSAAGAMDAVADAARELLAGLAQIDDVAHLFAPGTAAGVVADGLAADLSGELAVLFAEVGELLARLIATFIAILEALVKVLRSDASDSPPAATTGFQQIAVAIGRDEA